MNQPFCTNVLDLFLDYKEPVLIYKQDALYQAIWTLQVGPCMSPLPVHHAEEQSLHLAAQAKDHT
jgi:hypothetical protein